MKNPNETQPARSAARRAETVLLGLTLIWGATFVIVKSAMADASPQAFIAIRFAVAAVACVVVFRGRALRLNRALALDGLRLGTMLYIGFILQTAGLKYTTASNSGFITGTSVVFTPVIQIAIERRFPKWNHVAGIAVVVLGLLFLSGINVLSWNYGDVLTLLCAVSFSFYIVWLDVIAPKHEAAALTAFQLLIVTVLAFIALPFIGAGSVTFSGSFVLALLYTAILATVLTTFLQTKFQHFTTPTKAAVIYTAEPVFAAICGHFLLGETFSARGWIGAGLILAGVLVSELAGKRQEI